MIEGYDILELVFSVVRPVSSDLIFDRVGDVIEVVDLPEVLLIPVMSDNDFDNELLCPDP